MTETHESRSEHLGTIDVHGWRIPVALTLPSSHDPTLPSAILLIPGSLFSDVNGDYPSWQAFPHVYAHLARQLSERGHAVFRFAKLGPGTGSVAIDEAEAATVRTWAGRLVIADAAFDAMRRELGARGVVVERTIVAGHSEGSVVASQLATSNHASEIDGVVLLAGPSVGLLDIMREQTRAMTPPDELDATIARLDAVIACIRRGEAVPPALATGPGMGATALAQMPDEARRYMRETDATDPLELARALVQPVLIVQGGRDDSVPEHHGEALRDALRHRHDGERDTRYVYLPEVSHMFKLVPSGTPREQAFGYPGPTDARVADAVDHWIRSKFP